MDRDDKAELKREDWIAGLEKGLAIMELFNSQHARLTASEAASLLGMTRTAARRYLLTLRHLGYVDSDGRAFFLTPRVLRVGWSYFDSARLPRMVQPYLQQLSVAISEAVYVSVLDDWELVYIARNSAARVMNTGFVLGARVPAPLTASGVTLLAHHEDPDAVEQWLMGVQLPPFTPYTITNQRKLLDLIAESRAAGYAVVEQQLQIGVRGIAVPLKNRAGKVVGALSTNMPMRSETPRHALERVLQPLQESALSMLNIL